ncbi:MAG: nucleotidyl transferase AbiEii/AbiGii toxin family protein [Desulfobacterales bacterium]|jgi:predicted nucleotidyltransferase component of viral defense system
MDIFHRHEVFEIEVLEKLNSAKLLDPLVFGGGTMLRLCHELDRYSVDLDFWFFRKTSQPAFFERLQKALAEDYEITDAQIKHFTVLVEIRSSTYPKRLKIEIRREQKKCDFQTKIAFSRFSTQQVMLRAHTLDQTMKNKIDALLDRGEIRDCFDIEFMLRRGTKLPDLSINQVQSLMKRTTGFKDKDFKVKLGSIVDSDTRRYYTQNRFSYLVEKLNAVSAPGR